MRTRGRRERGSKNPNVLNGSSLRDTKLSVGIHMYLGYVSTASLCHFCLRSLTPPTKDLECPLRKEYCPYSGGHLQIDFESCNIFEIAKKRAFIRHMLRQNLSKNINARSLNVVVAKPCLKPTFAVRARFSKLLLILLEVKTFLIPRAGASSCHRAPPQSGPPSPSHATSLTSPTLQT